MDWGLRLIREEDWASRLSRHSGEPLGTSLLRVMLHIRNFFTKRSAPFFTRGSNSNQPMQPTLARKVSVTQFVRKSGITPVLLGRHRHHPTGTFG
jgi:hypothetical protein